MNIFLYRARGAIRPKHAAIGIGVAVHCSGVVTKVAFVHADGVGREAAVVHM